MGLGVAQKGQNLLQTQSLLILVLFIEGLVFHRKIQPEFFDFAFEISFPVGLQGPKP